MMGAFSMLEEPRMTTAGDGCVKTPSINAAQSIQKAEFLQTLPITHHFYLYIPVQVREAHLKPRCHSRRGQQRTNKAISNRHEFSLHGYLLLFIPSPTLSSQPTSRVSLIGEGKNGTEEYEVSF